MPRRTRGGCDSDLARKGPADLVVFAVKLGDTATAARALDPVRGPQTRILTLQNGIDSVDLIQAHACKTAVRGGVICVSAMIDRPGVIRSPGGLHVIVADAAGGDPVMAAFFAACGRATALQAKPTDDIRSVLWEKFIALSALSATTSLLRAPMGAILGHPRITHESEPASDNDRFKYRLAVMETLQRCTPLPFTEGLGGAIAGRPFAIRFGIRKLPPKPVEKRAWLTPKIL